MAIVPPGPALAELSAAVSRLRAGEAAPGYSGDRPGYDTVLPGPGQELAAGGGSERLRWTSSEQWHLTLAFLGEVEERVLDQLHIRLERAAARHRVQRLAIAGAGAFPRPHRARILWAGVEANKRALAALAASVGAAARRAGAPPPVQGRRFAAHLTLARCREDADLSQFTGALAGFAGRPWTAESVRLVRSHPVSGQAGRPPRYEELARWPLRPDGTP